MGNSPPSLAITGATGFIGRALCERLLREGYRLKALVRDPTAAQHLAEQGVELVHGDLASTTALQQLLEGTACLVHCAASVRGNSQLAFDRVNVEGTAALVKASLASTTPPRFIYLSSLAAREHDLSWYARSKHSSEQMLLRATDRLDPVILRPPPVYGPGDVEMLPVFRLMKRGIAPVFGSTDARLSLLHVDDLVEAVLACIRHPGIGPGPLAPTDPQLRGYSWQEMADIASRLWERPVRLIRVPAGVLDLVAAANLGLSRLFRYAPMLTPSKVRELRHDDWVADCSPLASATGWQPRIGLEEGLEHLAKTVL